MTSDSVAQDQIKAFVDRIIRLREEGRAIKGDEKEVYAEAKGNGYDKTALGKLVLHVERHSDSKTAAKAVEQGALLDLYLEAYYGPSHTHAHAREADTSSTAARKDVQQHLTRRSDEPSGHQPNLDQGGENPKGGDVAPVTRQPAAGTQAPPVETIPGNNAEAAENEVEVALVASSSAQPISSRAIEVSTAQPSTGVDTPFAGTGGEADRQPNIVPIRTHNPETHFLNSKGLLRLHGCNKPEACAGSFKALCFGCSVKHGGPSPMGGVA